MPYIGKDWRSPGEIWIKTLEGWKTCRTVTIRDDKEKSITRMMRQGQIKVTEDQSYKWCSNLPYIVLPGFPNRGPLFYFVSRKNSKEVDCYSTAGEAILSLRMRQSVEDPRRFIYICRLTESLLKYNSSPVEGRLRKEILKILEEICYVALKTEKNVHIAKRLVKLAGDCLVSERHLYRFQKDLYETRVDIILNLKQKLDNFKIRKLMIGCGKNGLTLESLPRECLELIISCFSDHKDLGCMSLVNRTFYHLAEKQNVWKNLCAHSFSIPKIKMLNNDLGADWKSIYLKLIRKKPIKEYYADILQFCSICLHLVWQKPYHRCPLQQSTTMISQVQMVPIAPTAFLSLFEQ